MSTFLVTTQILAYGVGIVSASINIATFVRRRRATWRRLLARRACGAHSGPAGAAEVRA